MVSSGQNLPGYCQNLALAGCLEGIAGLQRKRSAGIAAGVPLRSAGLGGGDLCRKLASLYADHSTILEIPSSAQMNLG